MIVINRAKAEQSTIDRLRIAREAVMADLDVRYMRAIESGADADAIANEKQALRDMTSKPLGALSLDALASLTVNDLLAM